MVYGCQIVVTNPTSSPMKLDLLLQVPKGAMPVSEGQLHRGRIDLGPYWTTTFEYYFYFPLTGDFPHYPVQVARTELDGLRRVDDVKVVAQPTKIDTTCWDYVSQNGKPEDVLGSFPDNDINTRAQSAAGLEKIAWRMKDADVLQASRRPAGRPPRLQRYALVLRPHAQRLPAVREYPPAQ